MSLGWQSESALLPSKATPINVDSKSMMSMKALVYTIEQKLSSKTGGLDKMTHKRKIPRQINSGVERTTKERLSGDNKYPSLKKQNGADMQEDDEANIKISASLRAKAALYDQIAERRGAEEQLQNCPLQNSIASSGSGAFLINFDEKRKAVSLCDPSDRNVSKASRYETDDRRNGLQDASSLNGGNRSSSGNSSSSSSISSGSGSNSNTDNCAERYVSRRIVIILSCMSSQITDIGLPNPVINSVLKLIACPSCLPYLN